MKLSREVVTVSAIITVSIFVNLLTFFYRELRTPSDRVFLGTQFYSDDYAVYVSAIMQGQKGRFTVLDKLTSEEHTPSLVHEEYLIWGKLTNIFKISAVNSYHLFRLIFGIIYLVIIYRLIRAVIPGSSNTIARICSFSFAAFSYGFLDKTKTPFIPWLSELDPTQRIAPLPHYLLGFSITVLLFFFFVKSLTGKFLTKEKMVRFLIGVGVLAFIGGFSLPSSAVVQVTTFSVFLVVSVLRLVVSKFIKKGNVKENVREISITLLFLFIVILVNIPTFFYYQNILAIPPWSHILTWEQLNRGPFTFRTYTLAIGPIAFLAPLSILALRKMRVSILFLSSWMGAILVLIFYVADLAKLNPTRFLQTPAFIPLSVLSVIGIEKILDLIFKRRAFLKNLVLVLATILVLAIGIPTIASSLKIHLNMYSPYADLIYPQRDLYQAMKALEKISKPDEVVLALYQGGNTIPYTAGNTSYLGHLQETIDFTGKVERANIFFSGKLKEDEAKNFLLDNRISLVYYGYQEKYHGGAIEKYKFLEEVFKNETVSIFRLRK